MPSLLPYKTAGWDTHREVKLRDIAYPIKEEPTHFVVTRTYEGPSATYAAPTFGTADTEFASAKLIEQGDLIDIGAGCIRYDRVFATLPATWSDYEDYVYTFPAYIASVGFGTSYTVTAIAASGGNHVLSTTATGISTGDDVFVDVEYTRSGLAYHATFRTKAVAVSSGSSVTIASIFPGASTFSSVSGTVRKGNMGRALAVDMVVGSRIINEYAFSTDSGLDTDLPIIEKWSPVKSDGNETDTLSTGVATFPNSATYADMVKNGVEFVAERSNRKRYRANIFVRSTRLVKAR